MSPNDVTRPHWVKYQGYVGTVTKNVWIVNGIAWSVSQLINALGICQPKDCVRPDISKNWIVLSWYRKREFRLSILLFSNNTLNMDDPELLRQLRYGMSTVRPYWFLFKIHWHGKYLAFLCVGIIWMDGCAVIPSCIVLYSSNYAASTRPIILL